MPKPGHNLCARTGTPYHSEKCYEYGLTCPKEEHFHSHSCTDQKAKPPRWCSKDEHKHDSPGPNSKCHTRIGPYC